MGIITESTTLHELNQDILFAQIKDNLVGGGKSWFYGEMGDLTLQQLNDKNPTWYAKDMAYGLNRLREVAEGIEQYVFYPVPEDKEHVQLIYMPAKEKKTDRFVILNAGGAYMAVCTMGEALPVAARLNELGIDCFCLNYTTLRPELAKTGLMPTPINDLAAAWQFIAAHQAQFKVNPNKYYVGGFSAGGHLAAMWGTKLGAAHYQIPQPLGLMLVYPLLSPGTMGEDVAALLFNGLLGERNEPELAKFYNVHENVSEDYPQTYLVQCEDDDTVSIKQSYFMEDALNAAHVENRIERHREGGHGFGLGSRLEGRTWVDSAVEFLQIIQA